MHSAHNAPSDTLPMQVRNTGFLLDRLGQDCHPLQFLRELTQNSIEAIRRCGGPGQIVWDVEWKLFELGQGPAKKLCVIDNGVGMSGPELEEYINQLSSSHSAQSFSGNYGVGAKISAATRNHHGLVYFSWKDGEGAMVHLWRDPSTGIYGLKQFRRADGSYGHYRAIEDDLKPDIIDKNGTMIVLLGNTEDESTIDAPPGTPSPSRWIAKYLNTRYFRLPEGVNIKAREGWTFDRGDGARNKLRTIVGQSRYLDEHAEQRGDVELDGAIAYWWILRDEKSLSQESNYFESSGHLAALYQDELYEPITGRGGMSRLQQFGVIFGYRQVVIYIEPQASEDRRITTNTARTHLLINNQSLPWDEWAAEFRNKLPSEIEALVKEKAANSTATDHSQSIRERLKQVMDLFKVSRYRANPAGDLLIDGDARTRGGVAADGTVVAGTSGRENRNSRKGGSLGDLYSLFEKKNGQPGQRVSPDMFPQVQWVSLDDGTRTPPDLEDRAARFLVDQNILLINADFRVFTDMITKFRKDFGLAAVDEVVREVVRAWFEQALVETVIGVQALRNSKEWTSLHIEQALSEEALTTAVMQRYHIHASAKRELASRLGKIAAPV